MRPIWKGKIPTMKKIIEKPVAFLIGNEGNGLRDEVADRTGVYPYSDEGTGRVSECGSGYGNSDIRGSKTETIR